MGIDYAAHASHQFGWVSSKYRNLAKPTLLLRALLVSASSVISACHKEPAMPTAAEPKSRSKVEASMPMQESVGDQAVQLKIKLDGDVFTTGQPIPLSATMVNGSRSPVTIWLAGFWPNHRVLVQNRQGQAVPSTETGRRCNEAFLRLERTKNVEHNLQSGQSWETGKSDLTTLYELKPGEYVVRVIYEDRQLPTPLKIESAAVPFRVVNAGQ